MPIDLTAAQLAVWFAQLQVAHAPVYQCAERIDIDGDFDAQRFASVLGDCLRQVPALNVRYADDGDGPRAHPLPGVADHPVQISEAVAGDVAAIIDAAMTTAPIVDEIVGDALSGQHLVRVLPEAAGEHVRHVWITRIHHIAVDGYSFARLLRWVADCYTADLDGQPRPESPFAAPGAGDEADHAASDARFWADYVDTARPPSVSRGEPALAHDRAIRFTHRLPPRTSATDRGWAESLMATLACYVGAYSGESDTTIGVPWANRRLGAPVTLEPEVNILPLRLHVTPTATVGGLIDEVGTELRAVRPHTRYRADHLRRDLGLVGADTPLYGPVANLKFFTPQLRFGPATGTVGNIAMGPVDDLTLTGSPQPDGGFVLEVEANPARYSVDETRAHGQRIADLLGRLSSADAQVLLGSLPVALPAEARRESVDLNQTDDEPTRDEAESTTLWQLLAAAAAEHADRVALEWDGGSLTYAELHASVADLVGALRVGRGSVVALKMARSPEMVIAILATLACGAAYLPIDPELPDERIDGMLADAQPAALLTLPEERSDSSRLQFVRETRSSFRWSNATKAPAAPVYGDPAPRDAAYIIFTSGSTGRPKGVVVEHRSIVNRLRWMDDTFALTPADRVLQKTPYSFDVSVWEFFWPLISGATLVLATPGIERDAAALAAQFAQRRITVCHFVPSALAAFLAADAVEQTPLEHLRLVVCSGEALPPDVLRHATDTLPAAVHNLYGPTEAAVDVTHWTPGPDWTGDEVPIGSPIANTACYVLDKALRPQPAGAVGELYLSGIQLARGYLGRPALTATRFVADPFADGERMYATGDLVHRDEAGRLIYDGRVDDQVKVRGRRIELGEIQATLADLPGVEQAVVVTRTITTGSGDSTIIVGYAVGAGVDPLQVRDQLARRLPGYMVPDAIEVLDALPMTRNGKLDRRRLPEPRLGATSIIAPRTPVEMTLEPLFAQALLRDEVSVTDSFFDLGGTSLSASALALRCTEVLGTPVGVADLFAAPSVAALAAQLAGDGPAADPFGRLLTLRAAPDHDRHRSHVPAPVFAVHPAGGLGWCYAGLLPHLDPKVGLYALQADGLRGEHLPRSLTSVATDYLDAVEKVAPTGPIRLLGWSVGGVIAHEMAAQASARGREVTQLVLLDAYPSECWADRAPATPAEVRRALLIMAGTRDDAALDSDDEVLAALRDHHAALGTLTLEQVRRITDVVSHFATLMREHRTGVVDVDVAHFAAERGAEDFLSATAWEPHVDGTPTYTGLPVDHPGMVSPDSLAVVADILNDSPSTNTTPTVAAPTDAPQSAEPHTEKVVLRFTAPADTHGVYAWVNRLTDGPALSRGQMRRRPGTDDWIAELAVPRGTMATYRFYPYPADDPALHDDGMLHYSRDVAAKAVSDPANPLAESPFGSVLRTAGAPDLAAWHRPTGDRVALLASGTLEPATWGDADSAPVRWRLTAPIGRVPDTSKPDTTAPTRIVVLLDADKWFDTCDLPGVLAGRLGADDSPVALLGIDAPVGASPRLRQLGANREFLTTVVDEVLAPARATLGTPTSTVWAGQSLGAVAALAAAAWFPDAVDEVLAYSPSMWWEPGRTARPQQWAPGPGWIGDELSRALPRPLRLAVGANEHLLVDSVEALAEKLTAADWPVELRRFAGGHDIVWWATLLLDDLTEPSPTRKAAP
ncbi:amino acid adenylation domain-containing protein [Gordonia sp. X0973]|nr:amino acid adenylation domain-containing protein [Gordonia sp. X0973]